jgi:hypothetical protein
MGECTATSIVNRESSMTAPVFPYSLHSAHYFFVLAVYVKPKTHYLQPVLAVPTAYCLLPVA